MILEFITLIMICLMLCPNATKPADDGSNPTQAMDDECKYQFTAFTHYPISSDYFQDIMDSNEQFTMFEIDYYMNIDPNHHDAKIQSLSVLANQIPIDGGVQNQSLCDIEQFEAYYTEDMYSIYSCEIPDDLFLPALQLIQQQNDYYFNAEEYGEEESLTIVSGRQFGHVNYIMLYIYPADRDIYAPMSVNAFCKGWDPGDDPPAELMPLINYLETVILPEMRQHPDE